LSKISYHHNLTTTPKYRQTIESEDLKNLNTGQSFSSIATNVNCGTSNGSSFLDEKKKLLLTTKGGCVNNNIAKCESSTVSNGTDIHAKSVDLSNQMPFKTQNEINCYNSVMYSHDGNPYTNNPYLAYSFCNANNKTNIAYMNNKIPINMRFPLNDEKAIIDNVMVLIKDQNGCRMLQRKFEERKADFLAKFYERVNY
jgi:hypothetical protein